MRLASSAAVLSAAEGLVRRITDQYFEPNLTLAEMHALSCSGTHDPLRPFSEACRAELQELRGHAGTAAAGSERPRP